MINEQNRRISVKLSAKMNQTAQAVDRLREENFQLKGRVLRLEEDMFAREADKWTGAGDVLLFQEGMEANSVRRLADAVMQACGGRCAVFSKNPDGSHKYAIGELNGDLRQLTRK